MATEQKIKSKKEAFAESPMELIGRNPTKAALILLSVILTLWYFEDFVSPAMRFACFVLAPQIWKFAREWLTEPVLFLLVNLVIVSIWITSGSRSCTKDEEEGNWSKKREKPVHFHSENFSSNVADSSHWPSPPHTKMQNMSPARPLRSRTDSDKEWQFSPPKRLLSSPHSDNATEILPDRSVLTIFSSKQQGAPLALLPADVWTSEIQSEQKTCQTMQPSSSYECESDQFPDTMKSIFQPQISSYEDARNSRKKYSDANRMQRRNSAFEQRSLEQMKGNSVNLYSEHERPTRRSYSGHEKSTWKSFSEKSTTVEQDASSVKKHVAYAEETPSSVIVRDVSVSTNSIESLEQSGLRDPLVIEKDELNERIEAFFSRFREQLRQDSLRWN